MQPFYALCMQYIISSLSFFLRLRRFYRIVGGSYIIADFLYKDADYIGARSNHPGFANLLAQMNICVTIQYFLHLCITAHSSYHPFFRHDCLNASYAEKIFRQLLTSRFGFYILLKMSKFERKGRTRNEPAGGSKKNKKPPSRSSCSLRFPSFDFSFKSFDERMFPFRSRLFYYRFLRFASLFEKSVSSFSIFSFEHRQLNRCFFMAGPPTRRGANERRPQRIC